MTRDEETAMVRGHVRLGETHIAKQVALINNLAQAGRDTSSATELLQIFRTTQASHEEHLARLLKVGI